MAPASMTRGERVVEENQSFPAQAIYIRALSDESRGGNEIREIYASGT